MNALTYSLALHHGLLTAGSRIDPHMVDALISSAGEASDAPMSAELWSRCLESSMTVFQAVAERGMRHLGVDFDRHVVDTWA